MTESSTEEKPSASSPASRYGNDADANAANDSFSMQLETIGFNKRVLEVGCAAGHMTQALREQGCRVVGIDIDAAAVATNECAEDVIVADLDRDDPIEELRGRSFDVVLFGDVLEHLRDPLSVLRKFRDVLVPGGFVVVSAPNVAHVDVRLALLEGHFEYRDLGLLDRTHLRFFTRESLERLLFEAGFLPIEHRRVVVQLFCTEIGANIHLPREVVETALQDPEALTYQFVIKAAVDDGDYATKHLADRCRKLEDELYARSREISDISDRLQRALGFEQQLADAEVALERYQRELVAIRETRLVRYMNAYRRVILRK